MLFALFLAAEFLHFKSALMHHRCVLLKVYGKSESVTRRGGKKG